MGLPSKIPWEILISFKFEKQISCYSSFERVNIKYPTNINLPTPKTKWKINKNLIFRCKVKVQLKFFTSVSNTGDKLFIGVIYDKLCWQQRSVLSSKMRDPWQEQGHRPIMLCEVSRALRVPFSSNHNCDISGYGSLPRPPTCHWHSHEKVHAKEPHTPWSESTEAAKTTSKQNDDI